MIDLANSLVERGIEITMAYEGPVLHKAGPVDEVHHLEIKLCRRFGSLGVFRPFFDWPLGFRFYNYMRKANVDIVNTVMIDSGIWCWLASRYLGVPIVHTPMSVLGNYPYMARFLFASTAGTKLLSFLGLDILAASDYCAWELVNRTKVPAGHIHVATTGVDLRRFRPRDADDRIKKELGLGPGPVIGSIGRLCRVKGCHKIISAMPSIRRICPAAQLLLIGDGPERQALETQAKNLHVQDNVIFTGWRTDTVEMTALMDVYIQTTDGPNLGLSALQAMAQAKPLVVFASDELEKRMAEDTVQEGINGYIVPTKEPEKAGEIIGRMLTNSQKIKEMGLASRQLAEERFDWDLHVS
ncbi:MAG: glycosyltransferase family 4 protein, partial [Dehalococcoidia bacterium]|nr:glycosyltransferase family 4 protein [Dehalococcoidia bacterium]